MHELQVFNFDGAPVRSVLADGELRWVAKDVAEKLGYKWKGIATVAHVPEEWRGVYSVQTPSGDQEMITLSEQGLWFFLGRSDKPLALPMQKWVAGEVLPSLHKTGSYSLRNPISEVDRVASMTGQWLETLSGKTLEIEAKVGAVESVVSEQSDRLTKVEERQKQIDPQAIEERMHQLQRIKAELVEKTKDQPQAITHPAFWRALKNLLRISSFTNRAALTVEMMDQAISYARNWSYERGVMPPGLFGPDGAPEGGNA